MIFETLHEAAGRGELLLFDGGLCHYHHRKDGQVTIRELLVLPAQQRQGRGESLLRMVIGRCKGATSVVAVCPSDLESGNAFYRKMGFVLEQEQSSKTGRRLNKWRLRLDG